MKPICDKCKKKFNQFGGLAFSAPTELTYESRSGMKKTYQRCTKYHICPDCWQLFENWLNNADAAQLFELCVIDSDDVSEGGELIGNFHITEPQLRKMGFKYNDDAESFILTIYDKLLISAQQIKK